MKDVLTSLAAVAAALATLAALLVNIDVTKRQDDLANQGVPIEDALVQAQQRADFQRYVFLVLPCLAALVLSVAAFFVHSAPK